MFLSRAIEARRSEARAASSTGLIYDIGDMRTGRIISSALETETGEPVSAESAYWYHAWYRAICLIAQKCAAVPRYLYAPSTSRPGGRARDETHPAYPLVAIQSNEEQTAFQFWLQMAGHVASRGNGYAWIWRESTVGPASELIPLDPDRTHAIRENGKLLYVCFPFGESGNGYKELASNILHFKGFGFDGLTGYPVWYIAAQEIGLARAERKLAASRFRNSGRPSMIIESARTLAVAVKNRIRDEWNKMYEGLSNAGKAAILDGGLKAVPISMTSEELGQAGAAAMSVQAISNYTGVPVSKLGGGKGFGSQEQEDRAFVNDGLSFFLNVLDDEATAKLIARIERDRGYSVRSNLEALMRPDLTTKYNSLRTGTAGRPFIKPNEAREMLDLPPDNDPNSDKLLVPLNMGQGGPDNDPLNVSDPGPGKPSEDDSQTPAEPVAPEPSRNGKG